MEPTLEQLEFDEQGRAKEDSGLPIVRFYSDAVADEAASKREGRPIYRDVELVEIRFAAERNRTLVRPASAKSRVKLSSGKVVSVSYKQRFPKQYERFHANQPQVVDGTPLNEAPFLTEAQRMTLKALNVYTVEQLAALDGQALKNLGPGGREQQQKAAAYLKRASGSAEVTSMASEIERLKRQIAEMQQAPSGKPASEFDSLSDDELKAFVKEATGNPVRGNPKRVALIKMAEEAKAKTSGE